MSFLRKKSHIGRSRHEVDPEEIFMDALNAPGFHQEMYEGRIERPIGRRAFIAFGACMACGFLILGGRLFQLQVLKGEGFLAQAQANKTYPITIQAPRGIFYDRNFQKLAENSPTFVIAFSRREFSSDEKFFEVLGRLSPLVERSPREIAEANGVAIMDDQWSSRRAVWPEETFIASGELRNAVLEIQGGPDSFPGVTISEAGRRNYLLGSFASHLLGYVGRPTKEDLEQEHEVRLVDVIGKTGLEFRYEDFLRGKPGEKLIEVNAAGEAMRERFIVKPTPGRDLVLEIDAGLQEFSARALARHVTNLGKRAGALVAMDPRDGAIRALVSFPSFDPNIFGQSGSQKEIERIMQETANPFFNRAISGGYPSASTIKPLMATAALEEGIIDPQRTIYDPGYISVPNPFDPAHPTIFKDWRALGTVDMRRAIAMSANVYFYTIGGGYHDIQGLGIARIKSYLERFGWGKALGIDLPGENSGLIPDPEKKKITQPKDPIWRIGDTYITSIGQGDLQITPLQLVDAIAAIANDGTLWRPRIAKAVVDEERRIVQEFRPEVIRDHLAKHESLAVVREGMRQAVTEGSAISLNDLFFEVAGKTGTAQTGAYGKNHGWFVGYAPYTSPELAIAVLVEEGTGGSTDAVPIAKEVLYYYFTHRDNSPLTAGENSPTIDATSSQATQDR